MIKIFRITIEDELAGRLERRTSALKASNADSVAARKAWTSARADKGSASNWFRWHRESNSNQKRDRFPRDPSGAALLLDPTQDDPVRHLRLILRTGDYRPLTLQGEASVAVFGLNRRDLTRGRAGAFEMAKAALCRTHDLLEQGRHDEAGDCVRALTEQPHASVLQEILRSAVLPGAVDVLGTDLVAALMDQEVLALLPDFTRASTSG
jgi:hypothetical protein